MANEVTNNEPQLNTTPNLAPTKGVWRLLRENPYIFGLSLVILT